MLNQVSWNYHLLTERFVVTEVSILFDLVYASNIPVILMAALLANVNMFSLLFWSHPTMSQTPLLGRQGWGSPCPIILGRMSLAKRQLREVLHGMHLCLRG